MLQRPSSANFTASLAEIFWSVTAHVVRGSGKVESRSSTARLRHKGIDQECIPVPHQSQEPGSREKWQAPWLS